MSFPNVQTLNILIADDEAEVATTIASFLKRSGHSVDLAADGTAAWDLLGAAPGHYHILITDSGMPGMSGIELVRRLRASGDPCKIIFLTGDVDADIEEECATLGVEKMLLKPCSLLALRTEVHALGATARSPAPK